jgi:hypothetical protein
MIKLRGMKWAGRVAHIGGRGMHTGFWCESQKKRDLDAGGRITLKLTLEKGWGGMCWINLA